MRVSKTIIILAGILVSVLFVQMAFAGSVNTGNNGIALKGYDAVAYFTRNSAIVGSKEHTYEWMDATWQFSSAEHKELFVKSPEEYAPQYGGYCAYAVSRGATADADPKAWNIVNGKLYLNISPKVQFVWSRNKTANIQKADANWPRLSKK